MLDGAVELEAAVGLRLLDGAHVVGAVDEHHDGRGGEVDGVELACVEAEDARVLLRGGQAVDLHDHPLVGRAAVTTSLSLVGTKCWVLKSVNGSGVVTSTSTAHPT